MQEAGADAAAVVVRGHEIKKSPEAHPTFSMRILYVQTGLATGVSIRSRGILLPMEAVVISTYTP